MFLPLFFLSVKILLGLNEGELFKERKFIFGRKKFKERFLESSFCKFFSFTFFEKNFNFSESSGSNFPKDNFREFFFNLK